MTINQCLFNKYLRLYAGLKEIVLDNLDKANAFVNFYETFATINKIKFRNIDFYQLDCPKLIFAIDQTKTLLDCSFINCQINTETRAVINDLIQHRVSISKDNFIKLDL